MLYGEEIKATEAKKLGLIDRIIENESDLITEAVKEAKNLVGKKLKVSSKIEFENPEKEIEFVKTILNGLEKQGKTRNQIHYKLCAESIIEGIKSGYKEGLKAEFNNFMKCMMNSNAR
jgi:enoyl-CoA hydratase/carnithine racemase